MRSTGLPGWQSICLSWLFITHAHLSTAFSTASETNPTEIHETGRCAIRDNCGKSGLFGPELPCPDNGLASDPDDKLRSRLVEVCGKEWTDGKICCTDKQLDTLESNLGRADKLIASCPACRINFVNLFCTFSCSPDQSVFVNVTGTQEKSGKHQVTELDYLVSDDYGQQFYDSCKDVKFGATNGRAMDLIGGGAKDYTAFLKFLGDKKLLGSPFQMNFPRPTETDFPGMRAMDKTARRCDDEDDQYRCTCVDCPACCKQLPMVSNEQFCHVGILPCLSFAVIIIYVIFLLVLIGVFSAHVAYRKHTKLKNEQLRLLHDAAPSDGEDEGDILHNAVLLQHPQRHYWFNTICDRAFNKLGRFCAEFPALTIIVSVVFVAFLSLGWLNFTIEKDPVRLWVAPDSLAAKDKAFFDENFGRFYRAEQIFIVKDTDGHEPPVVSYDTLQWLFDFEHRVKTLQTSSGITLQDICFKPVEDACVVQSVTGYFAGDSKKLHRRNWQTTLQACADSPVECLPDFQQPLNPSLVFGGYKGEILEAPALIVTWVVSNHPEGSKELEKVVQFENAFKEVLLAAQDEAKGRGLRLSFNTEVSLEQELNKSTNTDAKIVVISYLVMFIYASFALGSSSLGLRTILNNPTSALVQSNFMLGIVGVIIVLMSVSASVGLFSAMGIKVTLIIAEVIPFLVLAVGVDNIFLIVHEFERVNVSHPDGDINMKMGRALGRMGPSILLSATTETVTFALGAAVGMPAVRNFAAYAAGAVFINALLQVTMFVAVLALNQRRIEDGRADCVPCLKVTNRGPIASHGLMYGVEDESSLQRFITRKYAPTLLQRKVKIGVIALFLGIFAVGLAFLPEIELGLDQKIAIPSDSYLIPYFNDLEQYLGVGPPLYFVTRGFNATQQQNQLAVCGRFLPCDEYSLANILEQEHKRPDVSYISDATASWIDDFLLWLNPSFEECCVAHGQPCLANRTPPWNPHLKGMPEGQEFLAYLDKWLKSPTTADCPLAGAAGYGTSVKIDVENVDISASSFRTSHTPLRSQKDYISAYKAARRIANEISTRNNIDVFPYSIFYIFFDQYISIVSVATKLLLSAGVVILGLSVLFLGSIRTGLVVTATVSMTLIAIVGSMAITGVSLNAVSLVNLVICVGISLEFCAHIARAFSFPSTSLLDRAPRVFAPSPAASNSLDRAYQNRVPSIQSIQNYSHSHDVRAWAALANVGASVFSGITITKILGVSILAFTRSKIFEVYYFRVWAALVFWAALHALVFLPVALSLLGGRGYVALESECGLEQDLRSRRYPALLGDDDYDSDEF